MLSVSHGVGRGQTETGWAQATLLLLEMGVDVNLVTWPGNDNALMMAVQRRFFPTSLHSTCMEKLVAQTADLNVRNSQGDTALLLAVKKQNLAAVQVLLEHPDVDVHVNVRGKNALDICQSACSGVLIGYSRGNDPQAEIAKLLMEKGLTLQHGVEPYSRYYGRSKLLHEQLAWAITEQEATAEKPGNYLQEIKALFGRLPLDTTFDELSDKRQTGVIQAAYTLCEIESFERSKLNRQATTSDDSQAISDEQSASSNESSRCTSLFFKPLPANSTSFGQLSLPLACELMCGLINRHGIPRPSPETAQRLVGGYWDNVREMNPLELTISKHPWIEESDESATMPQ